MLEQTIDLVKSRFVLDTSETLSYRNNLRGPILRSDGQKTRSR